MEIVLSLSFGSFLIIFRDLSHFCLFNFPSHRSLNHSVRFLCFFLMYSIKLAPRVVFPFLSCRLLMPDWSRVEETKNRKVKVLDERENRESEASLERGKPFRMRGGKIALSKLPLALPCNLWVCRRKHRLEVALNLRIPISSRNGFCRFFSWNLKPKWVEDFSNSENPFSRNVEEVLLGAMIN